MQKISIPTLQDIQAFRSKSSIDESEQLKKYRDAAQKIYMQFTNLTRKHDDWRFVAWPEIVWNILHVAHVHVPKIELGNGAFICDIKDFDVRILNILKDSASKNIFSALVDSSWNRGYIVYIPKNTVFDKPIDLYDVLQIYDADLLIEKVIIIIESDAQVTIKDVLCSKKIKSHTVIRSVDMVAQDNAHVSFIHDQDWDKSVREVSTVQCTLGQDSQLDYNSLTSGGLFTKQWLTVDLCGEGARAQLRGAYLLNGEQQVAINAMQNHVAPYTQSDLVFKGVVAGAAHAEYQGTISIDKNAHNADATQNNKNILLGECARAYSIPNLQVLNNEVQCAHGSAVGQLDAEQLLYAQSRGLSFKQAQHMLLVGFLQSLFFRSESLSISERIKDVLSNK